MIRLDVEGGKYTIVLNGLDLEAWVSEWDHKIDFMYRYVQPMSKRWDATSTGWTYVEDPASLERCLAFLKQHPRWALSRQDHHLWGVK